MTSLILRTRARAIADCMAPAAGVAFLGELRTSINPACEIAFLTGADVAQFVADLAIADVHVLVDQEEGEVPRAVLAELIGPAAGLQTLQ